MGWAEWFPTVANGIFGILNTAAVAGVAVLCPPLAPVVGGALSIGGELIIGEATKAIQGSASPAAPTQTISDARLQLMNEKLNEIDDVVNKNQQYILDNQEYILENQKLLKGIKKMINGNAMENKKMMKEMSADLKKFESNVDQNFAELKTFFIESKFVEDVVIPLNNQWKKMELASEQQSNFTIDEFFAVYNENPARRILDDIVSKLQNSHTDPISSAIGSNVIKSRVILNHYVHLLSHLIAKVIAIEGFNHGLTRRDAENLKSITEHIDANVLSIRDFFIKLTLPTEKYWPTLVNTTALSLNVASDPAAIAENIKRELEGIHTRDVFTIFVFRCSLSDACRPTPISLVQGANAQMVGGANTATSMQALVLRSETYRNISAINENSLISGFRTYLNSRHQGGNSECDDKTMNSFANTLPVLFNDEERPHGFVVCNFKGPIEERLTGNATAIIPQSERDLLPNDKVYYGLSWV